MNKSIFDIDPLILDKEWISQPNLFYKASKELADARRDYEEAKSSLDVTRSEISLAARSSPEEHGLEKVTENTISEYVEASEEMRQCVAELRECRHAMDVCSAFVNALDHKKKALENLVYLNGQNYYSSPNIGKGSRDAEIEMTKDAVARVRKKRKKKKGKK